MRVGAASRDPISKQRLRACARAARWRATCCEAASDTSSLPCVEHAVRTRPSCSARRLGNAAGSPGPSAPSMATGLGIVRAPPRPGLGAHLVVGGACAAFAAANSGAGSLEASHEVARRRGGPGRRRGAWPRTTAGNACWRASAARSAGGVAEGELVASGPRPRGAARRWRGRAAAGLHGAHQLHALGRRPRGGVLSRKQHLVGGDAQRVAHVVLHVAGLVERAVAAPRRGCPSCSPPRAQGAWRTRGPRVP